MTFKSIYRISKGKEREVVDSNHQNRFAPINQPNEATNEASVKRLASSARAAGDVGAGGALDTASDLVAGPLPVGAGALTAKDISLNTLGGHRASDAGNLEVGDGDTGGGLAGRGAVLVVLLDDDTVLGDVGEGDVLVGDVGDGASSARDGLDADTVVRVDDLGVLNDNVLDDVVGAATDGADGQTVTTRAGASNEVDVGARVDGKAVILVLDVGVGDGDASGAADVESVSVVATVGDITSGVVDGDVVKGEVSGTIDGETLNRGVLDVQVGNGGLLHGVGVEELGLLLAAVGTLAIPPLGAVTIDNVAGSTLDGDLGTGDRDERTLPLLVTEAGGTLEGDGGSVLELGQVKGGTGGDSDVVQDDGSARGLALDSGGSISECAAGTSIQARGNSRHKRTSAGKEERSFDGNHFVFG